MIIRNARMVLRDEIVAGSLAVDGARIAAINPGGSAALGTIDFEGDYLLPGLVELHTDNLEKNLMPRPKVRWPTLPAILAHDAQIAAAGITTVLDAVAVGDIDHESVRLEALTESVSLLKHAADSGLLRAHHLLHMRCELAVPNVLDLLSPFIADPRVRLVSLMDHTPGQRQWTNLEHYRTYVTGKKGWSEKKLDSMLAELQTAQNRFAVLHRREIVSLCRSHGLPLATHDDTTADHVQQAIDEGVQISEFPTTVAAARAAHDNAIAVVMGAPNLVRGGSHSGNVAAVEVARLGLLDALSSDYVPVSVLHAAFLLAEDTGFALAHAVATISAHPANMVGLTDRGEIAAGKLADFIRVKVTPTPSGNYPVVGCVWRLAQRIA
jgi:alpha-D-ribose 1-methylphosphonate 5-triphosphate diphosphatase